MYPSRILRAHHGEKPNVTGFDIRKYVAAAGEPRYDPWENNEKWRYVGQFSRWNRFRHAFPGFGIAAAAFAVYLGYEQLFLKDEHHGEGHGEEHH
ncbi:NADH-ubiquinone oxidoreductase B12 subunit family-domain-containing protein [Rostrohypoxylon terebratum]|nr:NADH-ubiquinone oxidoreductase B12 subunit family-domain-containing protein [Rostrohypoxylon terebratum]